MKRNHMFATIATAAIVAAAPSLAEPGGNGVGQGMGHGMGQGVGQGVGASAGETMRGMGETMRDTVRTNSQSIENANPRAIERANENSVLNSGGEATTTTTIGSGARGGGRINDEVSTGPAPKSTSAEMTRDSKSNGGCVKVGGSGASALATSRATPE